MINKCGCDCQECRSFQKECDGCKEIQGKVFWTKYIGEVLCPIFKCCDGKDFVNCGQCDALPCKKWYDLKDPVLSDEEHINSINKRVRILRRNDNGLPV